MRNGTNFGMLAMTMGALLVVAMPALAADAPKAAKDASKATAETLTLKVNGVECDRCAKVITTTLQESGVKLVGTVHPNTSGPSNH